MRGWVHIRKVIVDHSYKRYFIHCNGLAAGATELCASHPTTRSAVSTRIQGAPALSAPFSTTFTRVPRVNGAACRLPPAGGLRSYPGSLLPAGALTTGLNRPALDRSLTPSCAMQTVMAGASAAATDTELPVCCSAGVGAAVVVWPVGFALPKLRTGGPVAGTGGVVVEVRRRPTLLAPCTLLLEELLSDLVLPQHAHTPTAATAATTASSGTSTGASAAMPNLGSAQRGPPRGVRRRDAR